MHDDLPRSRKDLERVANSSQDLHPDFELEAEEVAMIMEEVTGRPVPADLEARKRILLARKAQILATIETKPEMADQLDELLSQINHQLATLGQQHSRN